jgi:two-component system, NarL family, nitrate/nitrite response regulator NarL
MAVVAHKISVAVVDDHSLVRRGIREALEDEGFKVAAEGASADEAVKISNDHRPDVMLVDVNMPGGGVDAAKAILKQRPAAKILMLTVYDNLSTVLEALRVGTYGYVLKGVDGGELASIVRKVHNGTRHVSSELAAKLLLEVEPPPRESAKPSTRAQSFATLTEREKQILDQIAEGKSNLAIANKLDLTETTVKNYSSQMFRKLGVKNRTEAALLRNKR